MKNPTTQRTFLPAWILPVLALLLSLSAHGDPAQPAPESPGLLLNGNFQQADSGALPAHWERGAEGAISREQDGSRFFMRLVSEHPDELVAITQTVPLKEGTGGLELTADFRTAGVKFGKSFLCDARARLAFLDAAGKGVGKAPPDLIFDSHAKEWTQRSRKFLIPEGASSLKVTLCLNRPASGTLDIGPVALTPLPPAEVEAMVQAPLLAEKRRLEDAEEVSKMLALPPISPELHVEGNRILDAGGRSVLLRGVNIPSLEWSEKGEQVLRSAKVALKDWKANVIRLPVHSGFWFGRGKGKVPANEQEAYRAIVDQVVAIAAGQGAYVILDLHLYGAPKENALEFWKDAAARYANNPAVLFDLLNEPGGIPWEVWRNGGPVEVKNKETNTLETVQTVGMQALVDAVRAAGAKNIVLAGGLSNAFDLSGVLTGYELSDPGGRGIVYSTHFYNWHRGWEQRFLKVAEKHPVLVGEFGADPKKMPFVPAKNQEDPATWVPDALGMVQKYGLHWTAFSLHPKATPVLISDWDYTPTPFWGAPVKRVLGGEIMPAGNLR